MASWWTHWKSAPAIKEQATAPAPPQFIYLKLPLARLARPTREALSATLHWRLQQDGCGEVVSSGDSLGPPDAQGTRRPAWWRLDIEVRALGPARQLLREVLDAVGAPEGCEVHFTEAGRRLQDLRLGNGWQLGLPTA